MDFPVYTAIVYVEVNVKNVCYTYTFQHESKLVGGEL